MTDQNIEESLEVADWQPDTFYSKNHMVMIDGAPHTLKPSLEKHVSGILLNEMEMSCWIREAVFDYETMWVPEHLIPVEWEGTSQLRMNIYDMEGTTPVIHYISKGFNRKLVERSACGFYYALLTYPTLPKVSP